ncbi:MAG: histone H1 [Betaproteobacteria bacterium]|nr:histone H1 [Betaproteobacteria bacterium]
MPKKDLNQLAKFIVDQATSDEPKPVPTAAQESGRKGGLKGGTARAASLTAEERKAIAEKAAKARWEKQ